MPLAAHQPANGAGKHAGFPRVVTIARSRLLHDQIAAALAEQDLCPSLRIDAPGDIGEFDLEPLSILIFVCNVDAPQEIASLRRLRREVREPAVVVISPPATGTGVRRALDAGADALVFDTELELALPTALRAVAAGQSVVPRNLRASVAKPNLSHREHQVLSLVRQGLTNAEIAETLYLAESTIKSHLSSVFSKLGVHSRREAAAAFLDLESANGASPEIDPQPGRATA